MKPKTIKYLAIVLTMVLTYSCTTPGTNSLPALTTTAVSAITAGTVTTGGTITSNGGLTITSQGVCWSTTATPTITNSKVTDTSGSTVFTSSITGLSAGTLYHIRAFATNSEGTSYGNELTFTTTLAANPVLPTLTTTAASTVGTTTATSGGNITSDGGSTVTARGICWSTTTGPTLALTTKTSDGTGTGSFTSSITGLTVLTTYYARAYATNSVGTVYGNEVSFTTTAVSANTPGTLAVTIATSTYNGPYAPKHVLAIWVANNAGTFVKSLMVYAAARKPDLTNWLSATSVGNTTDAITGATLSSHGTRSCTWNGTNVSGTVVANGAYQLCVEYTESNGTGKLATFTFTKGTTATTVAASTLSGVSLSVLNWTPN